MPRRVPSRHGTKSSILYLHSPTVQLKYIVRLSEDPLIQDSLSREPLEDQVSSDISGIVQISKTDLMTRGVAVDLFEVANRVGMQREAAEHENLTGEESLS